MSLTALTLGRLCSPFKVIFVCRVSACSATKASIHACSADRPPHVCWVALAWPLIEHQVLPATFLRAWGLAWLGCIITCSRGAHIRSFLWGWLMGTGSTACIRLIASLDSCLWRWSLLYFLSLYAFKSDDITLIRRIMLLLILLVAMILTTSRRLRKITRCMPTRCHKMLPFLLLSSLCSLRATVSLHRPPARWASTSRSRATALLMTVTCLVSTSCNMLHIHQFKTRLLRFCNLCLDRIPRCCVILLTLVYTAKVLISVALTRWLSKMRCQKASAFICDGFKAWHMEPNQIELRIREVKILSDSLLGDLTFICFKRAWWLIKICVESWWRLGWTTTVLLQSLLIQNCCWDLLEVWERPVTSFTVWVALIVRSVALWVCLLWRGVVLDRAVVIVADLAHWVEWEKKVGFGCQFLFDHHRHGLV